MKTPFSLRKKKELIAKNPASENEDEPESYDTGEQTHFAEDVPLLVTAHEGKSSTVAAAPGRSPRFYALLGVLGLIALFIVIFLLSSLRRQEVAVEPSPSPLPAISQETKTEVQRRLDLVEKDIQKADPLQPELAFPPINFELNLEDATLRRQQQRR